MNMSNKELKKLAKKYTFKQLWNQSPVVEGQCITFAILPIELQRLYKETVYENECFKSIDDFELEKLYLEYGVLTAQNKLVHFDMWNIPEYLINTLKKHSNISITFEESEIFEMILHDFHKIYKRFINSYPKKDQKKYVRGL